MRSSTRRARRTFLPARSFTERAMPDPSRATSASDSHVQPDHEDVSIGSSRLAAAAED